MSVQHFDFDQSKRVSSGWNHDRMHVGKPLTDRRINHYIRNGVYSEQYKGSRRERESAYRAWRNKLGI